jgi:MarR family transcriptional regulator for hemolysin
MEDSILSDHRYILGTLLQQVRDLLVAVKNNDLKQHNITARQLAILDIISILGGKVTPTELSTKLLRQPHSISNLITRMEKRGLVSRTTNPDIKNSLNITLTDKGKQIFKDSVEPDTIPEIISCLSEQELQQLISSLKKIRTSALEKLSRTNQPLFP